MIKKLLALLICIALGVVASAAGVVVVQYLFPSVGIVTTSGLALYVDEQIYPNGTLLDWGAMSRAPNETVTYYYENVTIHNTGTETLTVYLLVLNEPTGISHTWAPANGTLLSTGEKTSSPLNITITPSAPDGTYSMGTYSMIGEA